VQPQEYILKVAMGYVVHTVIRKDLLNIKVNQQKESPVSLDFLIYSTFSKAS